MLSNTERDDLARDIKTRGLQEPIVIWIDPKSQTQILVDGRNRLEAMRRAGVQLTDTSFRLIRDLADPVPLIASLNIFRRHLTPADRANLAAKMIQRSEVPNDVRRNPKGGRPRRRPVASRRSPRSRSQPHSNRLPSQPIRNSSDRLIAKRSRPRPPGKRFVNRSAPSIRRRRRSACLQRHRQAKPYRSARRNTSRQNHGPGMPRTHSARSYRVSTNLKIPPVAPSR